MGGRHAGPNATPLEAARHRRADLHRALVDLEQAISSPAPGRIRDWTNEVVRKLRWCGRALDDHVAVTEGPGGLYEEVLARAPRLAAMVRTLQGEHATLRDSASALLARLESTPIGDAWPLAQARDEIQRLLGQIVRHREQGADLVWDAYGVDIGTAG